MRTEHKVKIGEIAYPADNSYAYFVDTLDREILSNKHHVSPANCRGQMPDPVEILSEPFDMTHTERHIGERINEFILVKYKGRTCRVINDFHKSEESAREHTEHQKTMMAMEEPFSIKMPIRFIL